MANNTKRVYVRFDLSGIPSGATINQATLRLYYESYSLSDPTGKFVNVHRVLGSWSESTITWNNAPSFSSTITDSVRFPSYFDWIEWSVTDDVQDMVDGTVTNYGWCVKFETEDLSSGYSLAHFRSKEYDSYDPELVIEYTTATYVNVSDSGTGTDSVSFQVYATVSDSGSGAEASGLEASIPVSDSGVGSETIASPQFLSVSDSGTGADTMPYIQLGTLTDSGTSAEAIALEASIPASDSGVGSEYVEAAPPTTYVTDSGSGVDSVMVEKEQKRIKTAKRVKSAKRVKTVKRVEEARD